MRFHSPHESFLLSYQDIRAFLGDKANGLQALSLKGFFNMKSDLQKGFVRRTLFATAEEVFGVLPTFFWKSPLTPYVVVLARKN